MGNDPRYLQELEADCRLKFEASAAKLRASAAGNAFRVWLADASIWFMRRWLERALDRHAISYAKARLRSIEYVSKLRFPQ